MPTCKCGKDMFLVMQAQSINSYRWFCPYCKTIAMCYYTTGEFNWAKADDWKVRDLDEFSKPTTNKRK